MAISKLGIKAIRSMVGPLLIMLLTACVLTVMVTYQLSLRQLERDIQQLGLEHKPFIENMLWQFDIETINYQLHGFVDLDNVKRVVVTDKTGRIIDVEDSSRGSSIPEVVVPLTHSSRGSDVQEIGTLSIHASDEGVWTLVRRRVFGLIFVYLAATSIVSLLILRQFNRNVLAPILSISNALRSTPTKLSNLRINLTRQTAEDDDDELNELVNSIHQMREQILLTRGALERGEKRLAQAARLAGLGYCTFDSSMDRIIDCDINYADFHEKTIPEMRSLNVVKDIINVMLNKDDATHALRLRERILTQLRTTDTFQINYPDGRFRHIRQSMVPRLDDQGKLISIDAVAQDVTDDILKQELLSESQRNQAIGKLTGGIAHDFNNILAVIQANVEVMQARIDKASLQKHAETALKAVTQGGKLTQQLLSFARKQPLSPVVIDIPRLIRNSAVLLQSSAGETINLSIVADRDVWNTRADPVQLEAVILNLVVNARDAMSNGGPLTLETGNATLSQEYADTHVEVEAGDYVCISLADTGTGMSPEVVKQAIEPFFTSKPVGKGTGLGLSMAFGFARQSGGHLKIESTTGQGTTVSLYLPRVLAEAPSPPAEIISEHDSVLKGLRVFLIEDNEDLRQIFTDQITSLGCIVHSASDEVSALALARQIKHIDVILSDIIIPGAMDGRTLSRRLLLTYPAARVIYISGFTEDTVSHNGCLDDGVVLLQKPFRLNELARVLTEHA